LPFVRYILNALSSRIQAFEGINTNNESIEKTFNALDRIIYRSTWIGILIVTAMLLKLPVFITQNLTTVFKIYLIIASGILCWRCMGAVIDSLDALSRKYSTKINILHYSLQDEEYLEACFVRES
jgi:small conductance mechanosensitive channel